MTPHWIYKTISVKLYDKWNDNRTKHNTLISPYDKTCQRTQRVSAMKQISQHSLSHTYIQDNDASTCHKLSLKWTLKNNATKTQLDTIWWNFWHAALKSVFTQSGGKCDDTLWFMHQPASEWHVVVQYWWHRWAVKVKSNQRSVSKHDRKEPFVIGPMLCSTGRQ